MNIIYSIGVFDSQGFDFRENKTFFFFIFSSEVGIILKEEFAPVGANSFL